MLRRIVVSLALVFLAACDNSDQPWRFQQVKVQTSSPKQFEPFALTFDIQGFHGNPYDPKDIEVWVELETPSKQILKHPAFYSEDHTIVFEHGREILRDLGSASWNLRLTPVEQGKYSWRLIASPGETSQDEASQNEQFIYHEGEFQCEAGSGHGFVRVSRKDPQYFETSDGTFFYPIGHVTRSPDDARWQPLAFDDPDSLPAADLSDPSWRTVKYASWFKQMQQAGENFCVIWMSPWWLGLEWSETRPGYGGVGQYNQRHAAQLDEILQLAEQHQIKVLLFTANHGRYSTVVDREWFENPHRSKAPDGPVATPTDFFESDACRIAEQNRLRYILARWGYSTALMGIGLCTETGWLDPYHGFQADIDAPVVGGAAREQKRINQRRELVVDWYRSISRYVRSMDIHEHIVTLQFAKLDDGNEAWEYPEFEIVLNNAYAGQLTSHWLAKYLEQPIEGTADGFLAWSRHLGRKDKPSLVAEWGGHHLHNASSCLKTELRTGAWAISMSDISGISGFWWYTEVDRFNLYPQFSAVQKFWDGYDRREKSLHSELVDVLIAVPNPLHDEASHTKTFVSHPARRGIALSNTQEGFAYIYHYFANTSRVPSDKELLYPEENQAWLKLPAALSDGVFDVEYWDPKAGKQLGEPRRLNSKDGCIPLPSFRVDLAVKLRKIS